MSQYPVRTLHIKLHKCPKFICQANPTMVSLVIWLSSELRVTCLARRSTLLFHAFPSSEILQRLHNPRMRKRLPLSSVPKVVYLRGLNAYRKRAFNGFWRWQRSVRLSVRRCVWQLAALIRDQGSINRRRESSVVLTLTPSLVSQSQLHDDEIHTRRLAFARPPICHGPGLALLPTTRALNMNYEWAHSRAETPAALT